MYPKKHKLITRINTMDHPNRTRNHMDQNNKKIYEICQYKF